MTAVVARAGRLAYQRSGRGEPLLLLHGIPGSRTSWSPVTALLAGRADVIVPDLLGFGGSDRPAGLDELHAVGQAAELLRLLDALDVPKVTVVGHDFGGPVALQLLRAAPQRVTRLGLLATNVFPDTPIPPPLNLVTWPVIGPAASRLLMSGPALRMMVRTGTGPRSPRIDASAYVGDDEQQRSIRTIFTGSLRNLAELYGPIQEALETAAVPGFVAWGDRDPFFTVAQGRRTADAFGAGFRLLEGAGHFLPAERPDDVAASILDLLARPIQADRPA